eukprot:GFUD01074965.1.p1 GENE.GFUD01074965.1~~GFUD01074965.1.p1  ORF type:complete len:256 (+),score=74.60 GFUD01074965.1:39-806(+)
MLTKHTLQLCCGAIALLLGGVGFKLNDEQKEVISAALNTGWQLLTSTGEGKLPEPKDISEFRATEFNFTDDKLTDHLVKALNVTKFASLEETKTCELYEETPSSNLHRLMELIGIENNLTSSMVEKMKLSASGARSVKAQEVFIHGKKGYYRLIKYTTARTASGNYDFMIANYGYSWTLDILTAQEELKRLQYSDKHGGVDLDMVPEEGRNDVIEFVKIHSKTSITLQEKEDQTIYFRSISERSLAYLCPKVNNQ